MDEFVRKPKEKIISLDNPDSLPRPISTPTQTTTGKTQSSNDPSLKKPKRGGPKLPIPKTKKQWIITSIIIAIILAATGFALYYFIFKKQPTQPIISAPAIEEPVTPTEQPIYSKVSGRPANAEINQKSVYAVQIENSPEARPQSGLISADIVSEAIAEGGITRFNAIYHDNTPASLGPIRSLRPYFIDWFMPYDAAIVHAGGSGEALADIASLKLKDIDHGNSSSIFARSSARYAPHNLYSTGQKINDLMNQRTYSSTVTKTLPRKDPEPSSSPTAKSITLNISRALYNVNFTYDPSTNKYLRKQGGMEHIDNDTKEQLAPDVVIVPLMGRRTHPNGVHTQYDTAGSGKVYVFQDGTVTEGTWTKASRADQWQLKDDQGKEIALNPGQRWFTMVESADRVIYQP